MPQITLQLNAATAQSISQQTVQCTLYSLRFHRRRSTKLLLLALLYRLLCLTLAMEYRYWAVEDKRCAAWSGVSRFQVSRVDGRVYLWRRPHEAIDLGFQQDTVHAGGDIVIICDVFR